MKPAAVEYSVLSLDTLYDDVVTRILFHVAENRNLCDRSGVFGLHALRCINKSMHRRVHRFAIPNKVDWMVSQERLLSCGYCNEKKGLGSRVDCIRSVLFTTCSVCGFGCCDCHYVYCWEMGCSNAICSECIKQSQCEICGYPFCSRDSTKTTDKVDNIVLKSCFCKRCYKLPSECRHDESSGEASDGSENE